MKIAEFVNSSAGLSAMARQLKLYGSRGNDTVSGIISRFAPAKDGNNVPAYVRDVMARTGFRAGQHLNLQDPGVLSHLMNAMIWHEQGQNPYASSDVRAAATSAVRLTQTNHFHITNPDPSKVAEKVAVQQRKLNSELTRNFATVVQ
jgi:hypothetical protein